MSSSSTPDQVAHKMASSTPDQIAHKMAGLDLAVPSRAPALVSPACLRLLKAQQLELSGILRAVRTAGPHKYVKNDHYAWWVWPTRKAGVNDPRRTAVESFEDARNVLAAPSVRVWAELLDALADALNERKSRAVFPSIDHGRIGYFIEEWACDEYQKEARRAAPDFATAFERFASAWKAATG